MVDLFLRLRRVLFRLFCPGTFDRDSYHYTLMSIDLSKFKIQAASVPEPCSGVAKALPGLHLVS